MSASQRVAVRSAYEKKSVVRGHHVYKASWTPTIGEELPVEREDGNQHDNYTVAMIVGGANVNDPASITQLSH